METEGDSRGSDFDVLISELERAIFAAAFVRFLDEEMMQAGTAAREDATARAIALSFVAVDVFRDGRKRRL